MPYLLIGFACLIGGAILGYFYSRAQQSDLSIIQTRISELFEIVQRRRLPYKVSDALADITAVMRQAERVSADLSRIVADLDSLHERTYEIATGLQNGDYDAEEPGIKTKSDRGQ